MARFLSFIHAAQDIEDFRSDFPEHEFVHVSQNAIPGVRAVLHQDSLGETMDLLKQDHAVYPFAGIVFGSGLELYVTTADQAATALGLRRFVFNPEAVRDKYAMRRAFAGKVACPETRLVRQGDDLSQWPEPTFPCVLKPRHGFGSICVFKATNRRELAAAQRGMQAAMAFVAHRHPLAVPSNDMLLENFVGGTEHNIELFLDQGQALLEIVSDKLPMSPPYFVKSGHVMPSRLPAQDLDRIKVAARAAAAAVGIEWGWAHVEIKLEEGVAYVIEIAARPGGGYTREIVRLAYNLDMRKILIEAHLGILPAQAPHAENVVFGRNILSEGIELVFSIAGLTVARKSGGFIEARNRFLGVPRIFLGPPLSFDSTILSFFAFDPSPDKAAGIFQRLDAQIRVRRLRFPMNNPAPLAILFGLIAKFHGQLDGSRP
jgi:biotin carboxylase